MGVMGGGAYPVEEAKGLVWRAGAGAKDSEDEIRVQGERDLVEGSLHVEVAADDVGHVVDDGKVVVLLPPGSGLLMGGGKGLEAAEKGGRQALGSADGVSELGGEEHQ